MKLNNIILKPIITEKSVSLGGKNNYVFKVNRDINKNAIRDEVERMYGVDVIDVRTIVVPGKKKRVLKTRKFTKTSEWKKAIVCLKSGQTIDVFPKEGK